MAENGVTRREFDRLERRLDKIEEMGSPQARYLHERITDLEGDVDRRLTNLTRVGVGILLALLGGLITLLTALTTGALT